MRRGVVAGGEWRASVVARSPKLQHATTTCLTREYISRSQSRGAGEAAHRWSTRVANPHAGSVGGRRFSRCMCTEPAQEASAADASHDACALSPQNSDVRVGVRVDVALISAVVGLKHRDQSPYTGDPAVGFKDVCRCPSQIFARGRVANSLTGHAHPHDH